MYLKQCNECKIEKNIIYFSKRKISKDGHRSKCRGCNNIRRQKKYKLNPGPIKEKSILYYYENVEQRKQATSNYRKNNPEKIKILMQKWLHENREHHNKRSTLWAKNHPDIVNARVAKRSAKKSNEPLIG